MNYILVLLACLLLEPLAAETIGNVEYHLPQADHGWKVANEYQTDRNIKSKTTIYIPDNVLQSEAKEYFAVHVNNQKTDLTDKASLEKGLAEGLRFTYANPTSAVKLIDINPKSALYEWGGGDGSVEKIHGWIGAFSTSEGTVLLTYQTERLDEINTLRPIWIKALRDVKILNSSENYK